MKPAPKLKSVPVSEKLFRSLVHPARTASISVLKFSADGKKLFAAGYPSGVLQLWDTGTWKELRRVATPPGYRGSADYVAIPDDWSAVYVPMQGRKVVQWEGNNEKRVKIDYEGEVRVWDLATGKPRPTIKLPAGRGASTVDVSPDGTKLLTNEARAYDAKGARFVPHSLTYRDLTTAGQAVDLASGYSMTAFSPDGKLVAVTSGDIREGNALVRLFDLQTGKPKTVLAEQENTNAYSPTFSPDGKLVVAEIRPEDRTKGSTMRVWNTTTGKVVAEFKPLVAAAFFEPVFSADGKQLIACDQKRNAYVWDIASKTAVLAHRYKAGETGEYRKVVVSPDGKRAAVALWPPIKRDEISRDPDPADLPQPWVELYDLTTGKRTEKMVCPHGVPWMMAFSPDGKTLAVGGSGAVHLFDVK